METVFGGASTHVAAGAEKEGHAGSCLRHNDTVLDGNETVQHGFQFMQTLQQDESPLPIHIVTARPDDNHDAVMQMLKGKGSAYIDSCMLPAIFEKGGNVLEEFK